MEEINFLSFGGGVDSSAILAMNLEPKKAAKYLGITVKELRKHIPDYDYVVFADPGSEWPETYENIEYAQRLCYDKGLDLEILQYKQGFYRHKITNDRIRVKEYRALDEVLKNQFRYVIEPYTIHEWLTDSSVLPMLPGASHVCSDKFKGGVQRKWADEKFPDSLKVWSLGIEANESKRHKRFTMNRAKMTDDRTGHEFLYPLIEMNLTREDCLDILKHMDWDYKGDGSPVAKSSCMWCPWLSDWEIDRLVEADGIGLQEALKIEENFYKIDKHVLWHEAGEPLNKGGRCNHGHHRQPYVTGFCGEAACIEKGVNKHGKATLIQHKFVIGDEKRRLTIREHVERIQNSAN